jgi:hypothetical protein
MAKVIVKDVMNPAEFRADLDKKEAGRNSKFGAIPTQTADGRQFASIWESEFYKELWVQQQAGEIDEIRTHVRYEIIVNGIFIGAVILDFEFHYTLKSPHYAKYTDAANCTDTGGWRYVDTKSSATLTLLFRWKQQLMLACHGINVEAVKDPSLKKPDKPKKK